MSANGFEERLSPLWSAARNGDDAAYRAALALMAARLRAFYGVRMRAMPDEVEDLVQETLLAIHLKRGTHDPSLPVSNWLHGIARYRLTDLYRRRGRRESITDPIDDFDIEAAEGADSAGAATARHDLTRLLGTLPDGQREAIELVKVEGLSTEEAATRMGITVTSLKVRVHRGLQRLMRGVEGGR